MSQPTLDELLGTVLKHAHADISATIPAAILQDTRANILAASAATIRFAVATDTNNSAGFELFFANGSAWYLLPFRLYLEPAAPDMGVYQDSSAIGYGEDYITDKRISNSSFGDNANTDTGGFRFNLTTSRFQGYYNSTWNNVVVGFTFSEGSDGRLMQQPVGLTEIYDAFSGNGQTLGLNGLPMIQQFMASMGSFPAPLVIDGGNANLDNPATVIGLLNRTIFEMQLRRDTYANLKANATYYLEGEPAYPTDKPGRLYVGDSTKRAKPVQTLDMAVCVGDSVVCNNDEIVYLE